MKLLRLIVTLLIVFATFYRIIDIVELVYFYFLHKNIQIIESPLIDFLIIINLIIYFLFILMLVFEDRTGVDRYRQFFQSKLLRNVSLALVAIQTLLTIFILIFTEI